MTHEVIASLDVESKADKTSTSGGCSGRCACLEVDADQLPELDARAIPRAFRQAAILGAIDGISTRQGLVLVVPHDPVGLLGQLQQRAPYPLRVPYIRRGPEAWCLNLTRKAA